MISPTVFNFPVVEIDILYERKLILVRVQNFDPKLSLIYKK